MWGNFFEEFSIYSFYASSRNLSCQIWKRLTKSRQHLFLPASKGFLCIKICEKGMSYAGIFCESPKATSSYNVCNQDVYTIGSWIWSQLCSHTNQCWTLGVIILGIPFSLPLWKPAVTWKNQNSHLCLGEHWCWGRKAWGRMAGTTVNERHWLPTNLARGRITLSRNVYWIWNEPDDALLLSNRCYHA
jgi:hypothetical protein